MAPQPFVLDCSITLAWYFKDEADPYADAVQDSLTTREAIVPSLWPFEVANALLVGERRQRATEAQTTTWLSLLRTLPIRIDHESTARTWTDTLHLARSQNLTAYDAAYLELALRQNASLATLDGKLKAAAAKVGIKPHPKGSKK